MKIVVGVIILLILVVLIFYGTLSPCGILKKVIANEVGTQGQQAIGMYALFGGFVERAVDTLNPIQCLGGIYKIKTEGVDATLNSLGK